MTYDIFLPKIANILSNFWAKKCVARFPKKVFTIFWTYFWAK